MEDARALKAREQHQCAETSCRFARTHRQERDRLVRQLRAEDPERWTYARLAKAVGCSKELIALIIKTRVEANS